MQTVKQAVTLEWRLHHQEALKMLLLLDELWLFISIALNQSKRKKKD